MSKALKIEKMSVRRGNRPVLEDLELGLDRGEMVALIGPNGSGKTTFLDSVAGLCKTHQGQIHICGFNTNEQLFAARSQLGYMVAQDKLPGLLTGRQCLKLFAQARGLLDIPNASLQQAEALNFTTWLDAWINIYSLGTRQKLSILLALLGTPPLVLLDEPLNGLDPVSALSLKTILSKLAKQHGCCILMAIHDLSIVEQLHDHILVLLDGKIVIDWDEHRMHQELTRRNQSVEEAIVEALTAK